MDLLPAALRGDAFPATHALDEVEPAALRGGACDPVDAGWTEGADVVTLSQPVAVHEFLDRALVGTVVGGRPEGVGLVQFSIGENQFMYGAGRYEDKAPGAAAARRLDESDRAEHVPLDEGREVALVASEAQTRAVKGSVDDGVA